MVDIAPDVIALVLGSMQDAGLPHIACRCARCTAAAGDPSKVRYAASLAVVDRRSSPASVWIIDAGPDIKWQLAMLADDLGPDPQRIGRVRQPDGVFLTHAHLGHVGGLPQFGPEAMAVRQLPVYGLPSLLDLLREAALWRPLLARLDLTPLLPGESLRLADQLTIAAVPVPHRDEWQTGTVAYRVIGPRRSLLYLPDIDGWDQWPEGRATLESVDMALVDASFFSPGETGRQAGVPHPLVPDTLSRFADLGARLVLTHMNHTNPILDESSEEHAAVQQSGVQIAREGQTLDL